MTTMIEPPKAIEAEEAALGAVLFRPDALALLMMEVPTPAGFYLPRHQTIYKAMLDLHGRGIPADVRAVAARLNELKQLETVGGMPMLTSLCDDAMPWNIEAYAQHVARAALRRNVIDAGSQIAALGYNEALEPAELMTRTQAALNQATVTAARSGFVSVGDAMVELVDQVSNGINPGLPTGYRDLDAMTGGFQKSELTILAARPGVGKTSLLLCLADNVAQQGHPVLVFSLEMSRSMLVQRLAAPKLNISLHSLRNRTVRDDDLVRLMQLTHEINNGRLPIFIDDTASMSVAAMRGACLKWAAENGRQPCLIAIDYLQLTDSGERYRGNKVQEIAETSRGLVKLARELDVPVLALSQLSRAPEGRASKVPVLSDLRDSGALEQDAANVMFIYREEMSEPDTDKKGIAEIHIAKQRQGPVGVVPLRFDAQTTAFHTLTYNTIDGY